MLSGCETFKKMKTLYNFIKYDTPKVGVFTKETGEYKSPFGWVQTEEKISIIGETDTTYCYRLLETGHGEWVGEKVIHRKYILPIGVHKSRLIKWLPVQLSLFN